MRNFVIELMQLGESLPREKLLRNVEIAPLVHPIPDASMAEALRQEADRRFTEAMDRLSGGHFVNLIVGAGIFYQPESIPLLLTNVHAFEQSLLLALRENQNSRSL
jgi:hypothetical protein